MLGIKQDALAIELGLSQQTVSALEQKEALDKDIIEKISTALKVPSEAIKNMSDDAPVNYINSFSDDSINNGAVFAFNSTFNPLDKYVEAMEANKNLYERLLQSEKEKVALLEKLLDNKK